MIQLERQDFYSKMTFLITMALIGVVATGAVISAIGGALIAFGVNYAQGSTIPIAEFAWAVSFNAEFTWSEGEPASNFGWS